MRNSVLFNVADLPSDSNDPNSLTYREVNRKKKHKIPVGTLVEVKFDSWFGEGACIKAHARLWVFDHTRDCDETPLYSLCSRPLGYVEGIVMVACIGDVYKLGFSEDRLTPVEVTKSVRRGEDALEWDDG